MNIILGNIDKIEVQSSVEPVDIIQKVDQLRTDIGSVVLPFTESNFNTALDSNHNVYISAKDLIDFDIKVEGISIYFDLEQYSFYQRIKGIIEKNTKPKGVFRFRRMVKNGEKDSLVAEDLYVLSLLLGDLEDVQIKQTDQSLIPAHTIIMMNFGGGTMAHIEYTVTDQERIELEWSGIKTIIEFDSEEVEIIQSETKLSSTLVYAVNAILESSHQIDQTLFDRIKHFNKLIKGGAN